MASSGSVFFLSGKQENHLAGNFSFQFLQEDFRELGSLSALLNQCWVSRRADSEKPIECVICPGHLQELISSD